MFSLARRRREAERRKKLEEVFSKADSNGNGKITVEQMVKIFEENEVQLQNTDEVSQLADKEGWIKIMDFLKFATGTELCKIEFQDRVFSKVDFGDHSDDKKGPKKDPKLKLDPSKMDRVELAFRKFDLNHDGFLSREEFDMMMKNVSKEQADRIFRSCDTSGDNKISLEEFRAMLAKTDSKQPKK